MKSVGVKRANSSLDFSGDSEWNFSEGSEWNEPMGMSKGPAEKASTSSVGEGGGEKSDVWDVGGGEKKVGRGIGGWNWRPREIGVNEEELEDEEELSEDWGSGKERWELDETLVDGLLEAGEDDEEEEGCDCDGEAVEEEEDFDWRAHGFCWTIGSNEGSDKHRIEIDTVQCNYEGDRDRL